MYVISYSSVISACEKCAEWERALEFLNEMGEKGIQPDVYSYSSAIAACEKAAKWEEAVKLLSKMTDEGVEPNVISYSSVISACEKCAEWEKALEFLSEMKEGGIQPNVVSYSSAISACEKGRQADVAISLLSEMKVEGIQPDVYSYSSTIAACGEGGANYTDTALSLLAEMKAEGIQPNVLSYSSAISACDKGGAKYTDTALSLFSEMEKAGLKPDGVAYSAITKVCFDSNRYWEALKKAREAADLGIENNDQPVCIDVSTENGLPKWDLHDLTEATACMLLSDALLCLAESHSDETPPNFQDIIVVTGKGLNTEDPDGPVLREKVPAFLNEIAGLEVTAIEGNEGRFLIRAASLEEWVASGAYNKFRSLLDDKQ